MAKIYQIGAAQERISNSYCIYEANILIEYYQGGDISSRLMIFPNYKFWIYYYLLKLSQIRGETSRYLMRHGACPT